MAEDDETKPGGSYLVGYCKPPAHSRFRVGQSGNPSGRRKGLKNFSTVLEKTLQETVVIRENGKTKTISKQEAITKQLVNKAASGDHRAMSLVVTLRSNMEQNSGGETAPAS